MEKAIGCKIKCSEKCSERNKTNIIRDLDPRTKGLMCLLVNIPIYALINSPYIYLFITYALILLVLAGELKSTLVYVLIYVFFFAFQLVVPILPNIIVMTIGTMAIALKCFLPFIAYGMVMIRTTSVNDVAIVLDQMKTPNCIVIPLLVLFRYIPTIKVERKAISGAMKLKGIGFGLKSIVVNPIKTMEYLYVPMLYTLVKSGEELTVAALTRGLGGEAKRSYLKSIHFTYRDFIVFSVFMLLLMITFIFER